MQNHETTPEKNLEARPENLFSEMANDLSGVEHQITQLDYPAGGAAKNLLVPFLDQELRPKAKHSITDEYPSLFGDYPGGTSYFIEKDGRIASHVAILTREFLHHDFRLRTGLVGSVVTSSVFRGMGMASQLLKTAITDLKRRRCSLAILWSEHPEFYLPLGFQRAGREMDFRFSPQEMPDFPEKARPFDFGKDIEAIWRLYQRQELKVDRSLEEMKRLCKIPEVRIFVTEKNGAVSSYIAINKGADFTNYIHEWAGDMEAIIRNIASTQRTAFAQNPLVLIAPAHLELKALKQLAKEKWEGVVGLIKILDRHEILRSFENHLRAKKVSFARKEGDEVLEIAGTNYSVKTDKEFLKVVFGDQEASKTPTLPFFLWGFDSI